MDGDREFRELLAADAALMLGVAEAPDVAAALQRYWTRREQPGASFESELAHIARLSPEALARIRAEVERLLGQAGGDAKAALTRHGGLDRSIHLALGRGAGELTRALSVMGVPIRAPLRTLPEDRYVGFEAAGIGGMGVVYAALDTEMNRRVAFKMVRPHAERGASEDTPSHPLEATRPPKDTPASEVFEQLKARLVQEAWVTGGLEHPGIVPVYEIGQTPTGIPYYTMRYVRGERTLADAIREKRGAPFEERLALLEPFLKVCDTLRYAHDKGVVHRDLKPANVALGQYGEVVLLDWGLARLEGKEDVASSAWKERVEELRHDAGFHTMEGGALGTAGYMAPEAALGRLAELDQRSDVYSLGAMLFEILTGRLPFEFRSFAEYASLLLHAESRQARQVDGSVPEALSALCARALSREKAERPASAQVFADAIRIWQTANALDREVEGLLRDARSALDAATGLEGESRLVQVDRAAASLARISALGVTNPHVEGVYRETLLMREQGMRQRDRNSARRILRRVLTGVALLALVASLVVAHLLDARRQEIQHLLLRARALRDIRAAAGLLDQSPHSKDARALLDGVPSEFRGWVWDYLSAERNRTPRRVPVTVQQGMVAYDLRFSPDGTYLAASGGGGAIQVWRCATWETVTEYKTSPQWTFCLAWSANGRDLVGGGKDGWLYVINTATGVGRSLKLSQGDIHCVLGLPNGEMLVASRDGAISVLDLSHDQARTIAQTQEPWKCGAVHPGGGAVALGTIGGSIRVFSLPSGEEASFSFSISGNALSLAYNRSGQFLAVGGNQESRLIDLTHRKVAAIAVTPAAYVRCIQGDALEEFIMARAAMRGHVSLWGVESGAVLWNSQIKMALPPAVEVSPDSKDLYLTDEDGALWAYPLKP